MHGFDVGGILRGNRVFLCEGTEVREDERDGGLVYRNFWCFWPLFLLGMITLFCNEGARHKTKSNSSSYTSTQMLRQVVNC